MFLTPEELVKLTGRHRRDSQVRALNFMGIEHRIRPDGKVVVLRRHVEEMLGLKPDKEVKPKSVEPNWDALN